MRHILPFLLAAITICSCKAQTVKTSTKGEKAAAGQNSLLWKVTKAGEKPSFLFGTMHMLCQADYIWTDAMRAALKESEEVCFEMDMDDPAVLMAAMMGMQGAEGKESKTLDKNYTPAEWKRLESFLRDTLGMDPARAREMGATELSMTLMTKFMDCSIPVSYEANIMMEAKGAKKEIVGLESAQEQLDVLKSLPEDSMAEGLLDMVDSFQSTKAAYRKMVEHYKAQDLASLDQHMRHAPSLGMSESSMGPLLDDRNEKWIRRMSDQMKKKGTFFAVGAGHLWGQKGVITLLRKAGYEVTPVL